MDALEAMYTTRAMRRVKKDPIPELVQKKILDAAIRAPSGGNTQGWRFLLVDDAGVYVMDPVSGHYTTCHSLSSSAERRIRKLARETAR